MEKKKLVIKNNSAKNNEPFMTISLEGNKDDHKFYVQASKDQEDPFWLPIGNQDEHISEDMYEEVLQFVEDYFSESAD